MIDRIINYSFLVPLVIFLGHQLLEIIFKISIPFIDYYLDPFCMSALALHLQAAERYLIFDQNLQTVDVIITTIFLAIVSEVLFPYLSDRFVADALDVLAIMLGAVWYLMTNPDFNRAH
ncbi:hypothetical protein [Fulvivirga ligni]|uniref:hypothetical protein n=1 Tax=Fulvivirga ligni TaxID=2904246 RepID=UPI001F4703A0|nr:hypothetical protein [Fulvivirga ligni]UII20832.1 hypothetical protein LVD16_23610 [Fulvivirga ligni]